MQTTFERGRFYIGPNGFPRFAGSSSGVYLADTIWTQLQTDVTTQPDHTVPHAGSDIEQAFISRHDELDSGADDPRHIQHTLTNIDLLQHEALRSRITRYFAIWHPLFPFLDGAYVIRCFDDAVSMAQLEAMVTASGPGGAGLLAGTGSSAFAGLSAQEGLVLSAIFLVVITLGDLDCGDGRSQGLPHLTSPAHANTLAHLVVGATQAGKVNDLFALQALLGVQLYLYATRALRPAMHLSGLLTKLACEAGLHRCPDRYKTTFVAVPDRELRKRAFYSLYTLDRLLSAEFGIPIMLSDTDIDTCLPGDHEKHDEGDANEMHQARTPVGEDVLADTGPSSAKRRRVDEERSAGGPSKSTNGSQASRKGHALAGTDSAHPLAPVARSRLLAANALIRMASMVGRAMELFNKSVRHRSLDPHQALKLRADLDEWWNDLELDSEVDPARQDPRRRYTTFFTCLYHQQNINLNRPALSLPPDQTQHTHALHSAIASVRAILSLLSKDLDAGDACFWPGYVDMIFFGCLLLVYGAIRNKSAAEAQTRLHNDLKRALKLLETCQSRWKHLGSFVKVVQSFIKRVDPASERFGDRTSLTSPSMSQPAFDFDQHFNDLLAGDFHFDFTSFALDPETTWAYHVSMPGSPML